MRDLAHNLGPAQSLAPAARTASANGTGVDLLGFNSAMVLIDLGAWTDGSHTFEVQESDDDSTYAAVADADLIGTEPVMDAVDEDNTIHKVGYIGNARYIRVATTVSGTTTGAVYGASIVRGNAASKPVA
jgi:hypothetical protein